MRSRCRAAISTSRAVFSRSPMILRSRGRRRPRNGPRHRQSRPAAPAEGSRGSACHKVVTECSGEIAANMALMRGKLRLAQLLAQSGIGGRCDRLQGKLGRGWLRPLCRRPFPAVHVGLYRFPLGQRRDGRRAWTSSRAIPNAPQRIDLAQRHAAPVRARVRARVIATRFSPASTACSTATRRRKASCAARPSCIRRLGISFSVPPASIIDNTATAVTATGPGEPPSASTG